MTFMAYTPFPGKEHFKSQNVGQRFLHGGCCGVKQPAYRHVWGKANTPVRSAAMSINAEMAFVGAKASPIGDDVIVAD
jgi:hypothetical protein